MGFVKGFRLKSLSSNVKPLNLRGGGRRDYLDQRDQRDQRDESEVSDIRDERDKRDGCGHAVDSDFALVSIVS